MNVVFECESRSAGVHDGHVVVVIIDVCVVDSTIVIDTSLVA